MKTLGDCIPRLAKVASKIDTTLSDVILLQQDYVARICSSCGEPCCQRVRYLFDEKDTIFYKVCLNQSVPRKGLVVRGGCPFLSTTGCLLAPRSRPFICHRYLCSRLEKEMIRKEPDLSAILDRKFRVLEDLRGQLWREYLETRLSSD